VVLKSFPPESWVPGAQVSQEVQCWAVGHVRMSVPHSPMRIKAV